ncbi:MAG: hypothetical protein ACRDL8_17810, partial [Solirubrobacteraceae bacterium]
VSWCIRAERVALLPDAGSPTSCLDARPPIGDGSSQGAGAMGVDPIRSCPATIEDVLDLGAWREATVFLGGGLRLTVRTAAADWLHAGCRCRVVLAPDDFTVWPDRRR